MVVLATFNALPVVLVIVLPVPVTLTVPPAVAVKAGFIPVDSTKPPWKLTVAPVLFVKETPLPSRRYRRLPHLTRF